MFLPPPELRLLLAVRRWAWLADGLCFLGDNVASLNIALSGKAKGNMAAIARELSVLRARDHLQFSVGHLPAENNLIADAISRLSQPSVPHTMPSQLVGAAEVRLGPLHSQWVL